MKLTEGGKLERPNVCFLCETTPDHGTKVIDTERYFDGHPFNLQGRRYVCEKCINSMLKFFDLADFATVERAENEARVAREMLKGLKQRIDVLFNDLKHIAENPNLLVEAVHVPTTGPGSGTVGENATVGVDPGLADVGAGEELAGVGTDRSAEGRPEATTRTYSGASLTESPFAQ